VAAAWRLVVAAERSVPADLNDVGRVGSWVGR